MRPGQRLAQLAAEAVGAPTAATALGKLRALKQELDAFERWQVALALAEGNSFAAIARELGLSRQAVHRRYRSLSGPEALTSPATQQILRSARAEARALGSNEIGSEHVVLAVLREPQLPAGAVLRAAGATLSRAQMELRDAFRRPRIFTREQFDPEALRRLLAAPAYEARQRGRHRIEVEDLLLAGLSDPDSGASRLLRALAVDTARVRLDLVALVGAYSDADPLARTGRWLADAEADG